MAPKTKPTVGKKRTANSKLHNKPAKALKTEPVKEEVEVKQEEGLFDNLDDEMDPDEVENIVNNLNKEGEFEEESEDVEESEDEDQEIEEAEDDDDDAIDDDIGNGNDDDDDEEGAEENKMDEDKEKEEETPVSSKEQSTSKKFRDLYMTKVTQAFGSDLDQIRQEPNLNGPRLNILIDSLEAGIDIFSNLEQEIILADEEQL